MTYLHKMLSRFLPVWFQSPYLCWVYPSHCQSHSWPSSAAVPKCSVVSLANSGQESRPMNPAAINNIIKIIKALTLGQFILFCSQAQEFYSFSDKLWPGISSHTINNAIKIIKYVMLMVFLLFDFENVDVWNTILFIYIQFKEGN